MGLKCRCAELNKCKADKELLVLAKNKFFEMYVEISGIEVSLSSLETESPLAYETENIEDICTTIIEMDDDIRPTLEEWMVKINEVCTELDELEKAYRDEDIAFHSMQQ